MITITHESATYTLTVTPGSYGRMLVKATRMDFQDGGFLPLDWSLGDIERALDDDAQPTFRSVAADEAIALSVGDIDAVPVIVHGSLDEAIESLLVFAAINLDRAQRGDETYPTRIEMNAAAV